MTFLTKTRYGAQERYEDGADVAAVVEALIIELETEKFDEPDDEHTQVAVEHGDWAVTVMVSGLMVLDDLSEVAGRPDDQRSAARYLRARSRDEASGERPSRTLPEGSRRELFRGTSPRSRAACRIH